MSENDFEKNMQDKMQGFDLSPSADLWKKVAHRIRKEKKRRFIFWWPLGLVFLAGGIGLAIWLTRDNKKFTPAVVSENKSIEPKKVSTRADSTTTKKKETEFKALITTETDPIEKSDKKSVIQNPEIRSFISPNSRSKSIPVIDEKEIADPLAFNKPTKKNENNPVGKIQPVSPQTVAKPIEEKPAIVSTTEPPATTGKSEKKKENSEKLTQWGLGISAGRSAIVDGLGSFAERAYANTSGTPTFPAQLADYRNSGTKGYFSLSAEVFIKRPLSPKLDIIGALGYQYLSTRILTGERVDSNRMINNYYSQNIGVDQFYRVAGSGNSDYYPNQFHFATLSGELSWRFTGKKANIRWNNGFSYNRLIGSSMLHYEQTLQGLYKDNNRLTKNHLFFNTALSLPVGKRLTLNPFASYSITPVMRNASADSARTRFSNFGLRVRFLLDRKK